MFAFRPVKAVSVSGVERAVCWPGHRLPPAAFLTLASLQGWAGVRAGGPQEVTPAPGGDPSRRALGRSDLSVFLSTHLAPHCLLKTSGFLSVPALGRGGPGEDWPQDCSSWDLGVGSPSGAQAQASPNWPSEALSPSPAGQRTPCPAEWPRGVGSA